VAGLCRIFRGEAVRIELSAEVWIRLTDVQKLALVAHEIFHCQFLVGHIRDGIDTRSLMNTNLAFSAQCIVDKGLEGCLDQAVEQRASGTLKTLKEGDSHAACNH
jgi:hypothetical protein